MDITCIIVSPEQDQEWVKIYYIVCMSLGVSSLLSFSWEIGR